MIGSKHSLKGLALADAVDPRPFTSLGDAMPRDYPERPIIGVGAVVFVGDRVVLVRRGRPPAYGKWSLPGGAVELGETVEEALTREVAEEVGLEVEVEDLVAVLDRIFLDDAGQVQYHYVLLDFLCRRRAGRIQASSDALSCANAPISALDQYRLSQETKEVIGRAFHRFNGGSPPIYKGRPFSKISS
jgi:ADP-ribose pyrophosphatase YjhB (NUDIX family)